MKLTITLIILTIIATKAFSQNLELGQVAPDIDQDMRYAGSNNFTGGPVSGYEAAECILGSKTAKALSRKYILACALPQGRRSGI